VSMLEPSTHEAVQNSAMIQLADFSHRLSDSPASDQHTLILDGESATISAPVYAALQDVLSRFGRGDGVVIGSTDALLTTSQAAKLIGISATYLLRLLDNGTIPVEYRGTHRRIRLANATAYLATRKPPDA
jgi:excisionase family DNA binding protein